MEVINKKGIVIQTEWVTVDSKKFLNEILLSFQKIRVGVSGCDYPFEYIYFEVKKQEVIDIVRMNQLDVTFFIRFDSKMDKELKDILYINKLKLPNL